MIISATTANQSLENVEGIELTEALMADARRAVRGDSDAALVVRTVKDLIEAAARHVFVQVSGTYPQQGTFPSTLYVAFDESD